MFTMCTVKTCRLRVLFSLLLLLFVQQLFAQNAYWSSSQHIPGFSVPRKFVQQEGKGIWGTGSSGLLFIDTKTQKTTVYNTDDSGRVVSGLFDIAVVKDTVYTLSSKELYKLLPTGKLQRVPLLYENEYPQSWGSLSHDGETITVGNSVQAIQLRNGKRVNKYQLYTSGVSRTSRRGFQQRSAPLLLMDIGKGIMLNTNAYEGIYVFDKKQQRETKVTTENIIDAVRQKGKGVWALGDLSIYYFRPDSINPVKQTIPRDKDTTQRLVVDAKGNVFLYTAKNVFAVSFEEFKLAGEAASIQLTPVTDRKPISSKMYSQPLVVTGTNDYYYADPTGVLFQKGATLSHVVKNLIPASSMTKSNVWLPDGLLYSTTSRAEWYQYNGKTDPKKIDGVGYGQGFFTDGKKMYVTRGPAVFIRDAKGTEKKLFDAPVGGTLSAAATEDGAIYIASNDGIGIFEKGKLEFTIKKDIKGYPPGMALQSIAVGPNKEIFVFFSQPYIYDPAKKELTLSRKGATGISIMYTTYFDGFGGLYTIGIGDGLYYSGTEWADLKELIKLQNNIDKYGYVGVSSLAVDYKGRCWLSCTFKNESQIVVIEKGKIIEKFNKEQIPGLASSGLVIYSKGKELIMMSQDKGITTYKLN